MSFANDILQTIDRFSTQLDELGVEWAVGGSVASSMHAQPRSTNDVDFIAKLRPAHAAQLAPLVSARRLQLRASMDRYPRLAHSTGGSRARLPARCGGQWAARGAPRPRPPRERLVGRRPERSEGAVLRAVRGLAGSRANPTRLRIIGIARSGGTGDQMSPFTKLDGDGNTKSNSISARSCSCRSSE